MPQEHILTACEKLYTAVKAAKYADQDDLAPEVQLPLFVTAARMSYALGNFHEHDTSDVSWAVQDAIRFHAKSQFIGLCEKRDAVLRESDPSHPYLALVDVAREFLKPASFDLQIVDFDWLYNPETAEAALNRGFYWAVHKGGTAIGLAASNPQSDSVAAAVKIWEDTTRVYFWSALSGLIECSVSKKPAYYQHIPAKTVYHEAEVMISIYQPI